MCYKISLFFILVIFSGCSLLSKRGSIDEKSREAAGKKKNEFIHRVQYDELKHKYDQLSQENKILKSKLSRNTNEPEELMDYSSTINKTVKSINSKGLEETVDLFSEVKPFKGTKTNKAIKKNNLETSADIQSQLDLLSTASSFISKNEFDKAMAKLKLTESSSINVIAAESKFLIGEIMFKQNEYDLAMQLFEEIIFKYAETSIVLPALKKLIICTQKLKLSSKNAKYSSYYYDLFKMDKK